MKQNIIAKIAKTKWMSDEKTKAESIEKINKLHGSLLGSNIFFNYTFLQQRYSGVSMHCNYIKTNRIFRYYNQQNQYVIE